MEPEVDHGRAGSGCNSLVWPKADLRRERAHGHPQGSYTLLFLFGVYLGPIQSYDWHAVSASRPGAMSTTLPRAARVGSI